MAPLSRSDHIIRWRGFNWLCDYNQGVVTFLRVDKMIAETFELPNPNHFTKLKHKDGNNYNDALDNLEWSE